MKLVWKNGSGATVSEETFSGNSAGKAILMIEELILNDWRKFGEDGDTITVLLNENVEDEEDEA